MELPGCIQDIVQIFNDYYGEERVCCRRVTAGYDIIVWFPSVVVTNEYGKSHTVRDIFVKIELNNTGKLVRFPTMARSTFTAAEASSNYVHSHCSGILPSSPDRYDNLCFGRGPLNGTMSTLLYSPSLDIWTLFCGELDLYVKTESVAGIPYRRLEHIGYGYGYIINEFVYTSIGSASSDARSPQYKEFYRWFINNYDVPITYNSGVYNIALTETEKVLLTSDAAKKYIEQGHSLPRASFFPAIVVNGKIHRISDNTNIRTGVNPQIYVTFKDRQFPLTILESQSESHSVDVISDREIVIGLFTVIFDLVNFKFHLWKKNLRSNGDS